MDYRFAESPEMYGDLHLALIVLAAALNIVVYRFIRKRPEDFLLRLLRALGLFMIAAEIFKQWFCYTYIYGEVISFRYFPWQLCSMAMYLSFAAGYLKGRARESALVYLSTFSLLGAVMALASPAGMLLDHAVFTLHSFAYHALIISESMIAVAILRKGKRPSFSSSLPLFGLTVVIAMIINVLSRYLVNDPGREADMFYINPFYPTTQPVFRSIALKFGNVTEAIIYLLCVILAAYLIFLAENRLCYTDNGTGSGSGIQPDKTYIISLNRERSVIALIAGVITFTCCLYAIVIGLGDRPNITQAGIGLNLFRFFTVNSNIFAAFGAVLMLPYAVEGIRKKYFTCPGWVQIIQYSGAVCTGITMLFVLLIMLPVGGAYMAFGGIYIWLHLVCPLMALFLLFCVESNIRLTKKEAIIALCPFLVYAAVYYTEVVIMGPEEGGWPDLYSITKYVSPLVGMIGMVALGLAVTFGIRLLFNKAAERRHRELQRLWDDTLTPVDIRIETYGLGRFNGLHSDIRDITMPVDIFRDLAEKYSLSVGDLMKAYSKGVENGLEEKGAIASKR